MMTYDAFRTGELQGWDARADDYDTATARATIQSIPDLLAAARLAPGLRLLDVCCGPGYATGAAAALGVEAQGIDFAPGMVRAAQTRFPAATFDVGDAENLPFDDASFNAVVCNFGLNHVTDPGRAMREAIRVLVPGGFYTFSVWLPPDRNPAFNLIFGTLTAHADMTLAPKAPDAFALTAPKAAETMLREAGFDTLGVRDVQNILKVPADGLFNFFYRFSVRFALIHDPQTETVQRAIRAEFDRTARAFLIGHDVCIPMPSHVFYGQKPEFGKERTT
ncbi:class I SAM-dependent methyltransferase [Roseovarius sp.]|uniref:class I SAM-dependent methyltransferase n=1 Tax=Roseovarius sp. TaxID=1486281 RepID=UPI003A97D8A1